MGIEINQRLEINDRSFVVIGKPETIFDFTRKEVTGLLVGLVEEGSGRLTHTHSLFIQLFPLEFSLMVVGQPILGKEKKMGEKIVSIRFLGESN